MKFAKNRCLVFFVNDAVWLSEHMWENMFLNLYEMIIF